jgi:O-antigen ligase
MSAAPTEIRTPVSAEDCGYVLLLADVVVVAVVAAYLTSPVAPLVAIAGAGATVLAFRSPLAALHVAVAAIPLELLSLQVGPAAVTPAEVMFALSGVGWATRRLATGARVTAPSPLNAPFLIGLVPLVVGAALAEDGLAAQKIAVMWSRFGLVYMMLNVEATARTVRTLLLTFAVSATVVAAVAIISLGGKEPELISAGAVAVGRATGSFTHPNTLAAFFVLSLPVALVFAFVSGPPLGPVMAGAFGLIFGALIFSLSRSGILATGAALLVLLEWHPVRRAAALLTLAMVLLTIAGGNPIVASATFDLVTERLASIKYTSAATGDNRLAIWRETPRIVADHPLFGVGAGNFPLVSGRYGIVPSTEPPDRFSHAHDVPLTIAAERGLVGLGALVWAAIALATTMVRACRRSTGAERGLAFAIAAALAGFAAQGVVDYALGTNVIVAMFFVLAGCGTVLARMPGSRCAE